MGQTLTNQPRKTTRVPSSWRWRGVLCSALLPLLALLALIAQPFLSGALPTLPWATLALSLGVVGLVGQGVLVSYLLRRSRPLSMIDSAVSSWRTGETNIELLAVAEDGSDLAENWNRLITAWVAAQKTMRGLRASSVISSSTQSEQGTSDIFDMLPNGLMIVNAAGQIRAANGAAGHVFMRSQERLKDAPLDRLVTDQGLLDLVASCQKEARPRGGQTEISIPQGEGQEAAIRFIVRPLGSPEDRRVLLVMNDVTHQRIADKSRNLFVAQATHELRTPLTNIGLYLERAIDLADDEIAERGECLNVINSEVDRLARVVEEFLSVSEIEAGSLQIKRDDVRVDELVARLQDEYVPQAQAKSLAMTFDLPPKLSIVQGDREKIALALHNLIGNAVKYTPQGKTIHVEVEEDEVNGSIDIRVSDTGIGISDEDLPKVFDKFYRADDDRLAEIKGTGLGLSLAREFIRLHGGDITVESTLNQGSTFTLSLPMCHPAKAA